MKLTIKDRISLPGILPQNGGMSKMILVRELIKKTAITSEDIQKTGMIDTPEGNTIWDAAKDPNIEITFNERELALLKSSADEADKAEKITMDNLSLIEKITGKQ
jgi:hypothetical protein